MGAQVPVTLSFVSSRDSQYFAVFVFAFCVPSEGEDLLYRKSNPSSTG